MAAIAKLVFQLFFPVPLCLSLFAAGLILLWFTRKQKLGKVFVTAGTALLLLFGCSVGFGNVLRSLEYRYSALISPETLNPAPKWVAVLGMGHHPDPAVPVNSQIPHTFLSRLIEGVRLHRAIPGTKLIISVGGDHERQEKQEFVDRFAEIVAVEPEDVVLIADAHSTRDEVTSIQEITQDDAVVLVTSAAHMPRAMAFCRRFGVTATPAPAGYLVKHHRQPGMGVGAFIPSSVGFTRAERVTYECLAFAWAKLRGSI